MSVNTLITVCKEQFVFKQDEFVRMLFLKLCNYVKIHNKQTKKKEHILSLISTLRYTN